MLVTGYVANNSEVLVAYYLHNVVTNFNLADRTKCNQRESYESKIMAVLFFELRDLIFQK